MLFKEAVKVSTGNAGKDDLGHGVHPVDSTSKEDMDAFDQLGPRTREVLNSMPIRWSSHKTLQLVRSMGMDPIRHDSHVAQNLTMAAKVVVDQLRQKRA